MSAAMVKHYDTKADAERAAKRWYDKYQNEIETGKTVAVELGSTAIIFGGGFAIGVARGYFTRRGKQFSFLRIPVEIWTGGGIVLGGLFADSGDIATRLILDFGKALIGGFGNTAGLATGGTLADKQAERQGNQPPTGGLPPAQRQRGLAAAMNQSIV